MFGTSWRVARIAGIEVRVDSSWVVIALLITYSMYGSRITLFLFGGATRARVESRGPGDEFLIALVGPLTSGLLAGLFGIVAGTIMTLVTRQQRFYAGNNGLLGFIFYNLVHMTNMVINGIPERFPKLKLLARFIGRLESSALFVGIGLPSAAANLARLTHARAQAGSIRHSMVLDRLVSGIVHLPACRGHEWPPCVLSVHGADSRRSMVDSRPPSINPGMSATTNVR